MSKTRVGDMVEILNGYAFDSKNFNSNGQGLPVVRVRDVVPGISGTYTTEDCPEDYLIHDGDLLIGMDGEFNIEFWKGGNALLNQRVCKVSGRRGISDNRFLKYRLGLLLKEIEANTPFATVKHLSSEKLKKEEVDLPPLDEQKRIATILSKADRLRRLRRYARELSDGYLGSVFLEMFGDADEFERVRIQDVASRRKHALSSGPFGSNLTSAHYVTEGVVVLRGLNISDGELNLQDVKYVSNEKAQSLARSEVKPGDVVVVAVGSSGFSCQIPNSLPRAIMSQNFNKITPDVNRIHPTYLEHCINSPFVQQQLSREITDTVRTFLSLTKLKSVEIPLPPIFLQKKFARIVQQFERLRAQQREAERQADHLFGSLLGQAFQEEI